MREPKAPRLFAREWIRWSVELHANAFREDDVDNTRVNESGFQATGTSFSHLDMTRDVCHTSLGMSHLPRPEKTFADRWSKIRNIRKSFLPRKFPFLILQYRS